jgi:20S proteasome alpha/beta subunit
MGRLCKWWLVVCCWLYCQPRTRASVVEITSASTNAHTPPWSHSSSESGTASQALDEAQYGDQPPSVFAPGGRLYSVERMMQAVYNPNDRSSNLCIAIQSREGMVMVSTCPQSPYLYHDHIATMNATSTIHNNSSTTASTSDRIRNNDAIRPLLLTEHSGTNVTTSRSNARWLPPFARLSEQVIAATGGNAVDSHIVRRRLYHHADAMRSAETEIHPAIVARKWADECQHPTQSMAAPSGGRTRRMMAATVVIADHQTLWRIDPSGQLWKCGVATVGQQAPMAEQWLYEQLQTTSSASSTTSATASIPSLVSSALSSVLSRIRPHHDSHTSAQKVRETVAEMSLWEAHALAKQCIQHVYQSSLSKAAASSSPDPTLPENHVVRLRCVMLTEHAETCRFFQDSCTLSAAHK